MRDVVVRYQALRDGSKASGAALSPPGEHSTGTDQHVKWNRVEISPQPPRAADDPIFPAGGGPSGRGEQDQEGRGS